MKKITTGPNRCCVSWAAREARVSRHDGYHASDDTHGRQWSVSFLSHGLGSPRWTKLVQKKRKKEMNSALIPYTQRNLFEILLNKTEIRLYTPFSN